MMKKILISFLILTVFALNFTGCTKTKNKVESEASKISSNTKSEASKVESDVESNTSEIETNDGGLIEDGVDDNNIDNDSLPEVNSNK